eukprot:TRINITY_DN16457_c0_g1_i1.p1 TRINITY_DN16457_c0_g1~~TRINITY_DN16457_c0_g1_i1.p1  ORF type:complete len:522 (-),score=91.82 TRINITY_DN16457_c0_g1_i1:26-1591(-)
MKGEIVTVQIGRSSNFVGTHLWNIQTSLGEDHCVNGSEGEGAPFQHSEIDFEPLLRVHEDHGGSTKRLPRLLSYDLKGCCESLVKPSPTLEVASYSWRGGVEQHSSAPVERNLFLQSLEKQRTDKTSLERQDYRLDETVSYWSDFKQTEYGSRSIYQLKSYQDAFSLSSSESFEIFKNSNETDDIRDHIRHEFELSDSLQGIQMLVDAETGFGLFACEYIQLLRDEFVSSNHPIVVYGIGELDAALRHRRKSASSLQQDKINNALIDKALTIGRMLETCSMYIPITPTTEQLQQYTIEGKLPRRFKADSLYHSSALVASALDGITLPFRLKTNEWSSMANWKNKILTSSPNAKVTLVTHSLPFPFTTLPSRKRIDAKKYCCDLISGLESKSEQLKPFSQYSILRGDGKTVPRFIDDILSEATTGVAFSYSNFVAQGMAVPIPYPRFFDESNLKVVSTYSEVQVTPRLYEPLQDVSSRFKKMRPSVTVSIDHDYYHLKDDWDDVTEQLESLCEYYEPTSPLE